MPLKICVVAGSVPPAVGGSQISVAHMVRGFAERGARVSLVTSNEPDEHLRAWVTDSGGEAHVSSPARPGMTWEERLLTPANELAPLLSRDRIDVVHAFSHATALSVALVLPVADAPVFCASYHEMSAERTEAGRTRSRYVHNLAQLDAVITLSRYFERIARKYCRDPALIRTAQQGIDLEPFREGDAERGRRLLGVDGRRPVLLYPARWSPPKGQLELVEAIAALTRAGGDGPLPAVRLVGSVSAAPHVDSAGYRRQIVEAIAAHGLEDVVRLVEDVPRQDMPDLYAACTAVVAPSRQEGLGFIGIEAMAGSRPFVAAHNEGYDQYCVDGVNALLTDPGDTDGLAGAIRRVLGSAELRDRLTAAGVRTAERFSYLNGVDDLIRIYGTLPAARPDRADY